MTELDVYWQGRKAGTGRPAGHRPALPTPRPRPTRTRSPPQLTGIDYLRLVAGRRRRRLSGDQLRLSALDDSQGPPGGNGEDDGREEER